MYPSSSSKLYQLEDMPCEVHFTDFNCVIQGPSMRRPTILGEFRDGLYFAVENEAHGKADVSTGSNAIRCLSSSLEQIKLWHVRLGYLPFERLKFVVDVHDVQTFVNNYLCSICPAVK